MGQPIPNIQVQNIGIYQIPSWQITQPYVPNVYPVTNHMGFPIEYPWLCCDAQG